MWCVHMVALVVTLTRQKVKDKMTITPPPYELKADSSDEDDEPLILQLVHPEEEKIEHPEEKHKNKIFQDLKLQMRKSLLEHRRRNTKTKSCTNKWT